MTIYLVRHGATAWSETGQHTGRTDLDLSARGREEARALGGALRSRREARVLSSPLRRARETARLAGFEQRVESVDDLCELDYGADEGRTRVQILADHPHWELFRDGPHGGEPIAHAAERARRVLAALPVEQDVLLFSHGHLLRILAAVYLTGAPALGAQLSLGTASVSALGLENGVPRLLFWNDRHHLDAAAPTPRAPAGS